MATRIGSLLIKLAVEHGLLKSGLSIAEKEVAKTTKAIQRRGREIADFGRQMSIGVTAPLTALAVASVQGAKEQRQAMAQVEAAITSMGNAAGRTSGQLAKMADRQEMNSLFNADVILTQVTANLLTFGRVAESEFDRAQQAALDMATRLGGEPQAAAIMLGKALNDPVKGITALTRVGVQFTDAQKEQIRTMTEAGNVAGAQGVILAEVERQFRGAAKAAADTDPWRKSQVAMDQAMDVIGEKLIPLLPKLTDAIVQVLSAFTALPDGMQQTIIVAAGLGMAFGPLLMGLGAIITAVGPAIATLWALKKALDWAGMLRVLIPMIGVLGKALLGVLLNPVILTAAVVIGGIYLAWKNWDKIGPIVQRLYQAVKTWVMDKLGAVLDFVRKRVEQVESAFAWLYDRVVGNSWVPDMVEKIAHHMGRLGAVMVDPAQKATASVSESMREMAAETKTLLDRLFPEVQRLMNYRRDMALLDKSGLPESQRDEARRRLGTEFAGFGIGSNPNAPISEAVLNAPSLAKAIGDAWRETQKLGEKAQVTTVRVAKSFKDMADETMGALRRMTDAIKGGGFLDILESVIGFGLQLGSIGAFGKSIATRINSVPRYARGTNYHPGGLALVGEEGPEFVNLRRGAQVFSNAESRALMGGRGGIAHIVPSPYFDVVVDGRVQAHAPDIASAGAGMAHRQAAASGKWRLGR